MSQDIATKLKIWLFPSLVTILGTLIWRDISELKSDVKALLAQSNVDKTRIDNLERFIYNHDKTTRVAFYEGITPDEEPKRNKTLIAYTSKEFITNDSKKKRIRVQLKRATA